MAQPNPSDKVNRLIKYTEGLKQRLGGNMLTPQLREVIQIDLRKTEKQIAKLRGV